MASDAVDIVLDWDGNDIQNEDGIFLEMPHFGILVVKGTDSERSTEGQLARNRVGDYRKIPLVGLVSSAVGGALATQWASFYNQWDLLLQWFDPRFLKVLTATVPDGTVRTINGRPEPPLVVPYPGGVPAGLVSIELRSVDPNWDVTEPP